MPLAKSPSSHNISSLRKKSSSQSPCARWLSAGILFFILSLLLCLYFPFAFYADANKYKNDDSSSDRQNATDIPPNFRFTSDPIPEVSLSLDITTFLDPSSPIDTYASDVMTNSSSISPSELPDAARSLVSSNPTAEEIASPSPVSHVTTSNEPSAPDSTAFDLSTATSDELSTAPERQFPFIPKGRNSGDPFFTICALIRSETDIREWVHHYVHHFDVSRIYIYDHGSHPRVRQVVPDYISAGRVKVVPWPPPKKKLLKNFMDRVHMHAYNDCLRRTKNAKPRHEWVAFFDGDEYLWLSPTWKARGIRPFLSLYKDAGAFGVQWLYHGSDARVQRPKDGVRKSYVSCLHDINHHIKSIVHIPFGVQAITPHHFELENGKETVTETYEVVPGPFAVTASMQNISLHHYVIRSEEDFAKKVAKTGPNGKKGFSVKDWDFFRIIANTTVETCPELVEWI